MADRLVRTLIDTINDRDNVGGDLPDDWTDCHQSQVINHIRRSRYPYSFRFEEGKFDIRVQNDQSDVGTLPLVLLLMTGTFVVGLFCGRASSHN